MKYKYLLFSLLLILIVFTGACSNLDTNDEGWKLVYRNSAQGEAIFGDKNDLISAVRNGLPVRIGFGGRSRTDSTRSVEHLATAQFLTILNNEEVFAQIEQIIGRTPVNEEDGLKLRFRPSNKWSMITGTNGYSTGIMVDYLADSLMSAPRDRNRGTSWFVFYSGGKGRDVLPLYDD